ncbi:MAG: hypothetical protein ACYCQI_04370 [Gammaproteobacteria bacterium]
MKSFFNRKKKAKDTKEVKSPTESKMPELPVGTTVNTPERDKKKKAPTTKTETTSSESDFDIINPTAPVVLNALMAQLRHFIAATARYSQPVLLTKNLLLIEREGEHFQTYPDLFDLEEQQRADPKVLRAFSKFYEIALQAGDQSEEVRPLTRLAIGKDCCVALRGTTLHVLDTRDLYECHMKSFELRDYQAFSANQMRAVKYGSKQIKIFPNQKYIAIANEGEGSKKQDIFIVNLETGKMFKITHPLLKEMNLDKFVIVDDNHILAFYTRKVFEPTYAVLEIDYVNERASLDTCFCASQPPEKKLSEMLYLSNGLFVTLQKTSQSQSDPKRLDLWELKEGGVNWLSTHAAKRVFRLDTGEGYFIEPEKGDFRAKMIDPVARHIVNLELLSDYPQRQCLAFPRTVVTIPRATTSFVHDLQMVQLHVIPDCLAREKTVTRYTTELDEALDKIANFRSTISNIVKSYLSAEYEATTLFRLPHWPSEPIEFIKADKVHDGKLIKLDDDYMAQLRSLLSLTLPVLHLQEIQSVSNLKTAIDLQIKKVDAVERYLNEVGRIVYTDRPLTEGDIQKILKDRENLPASLALKNIKALFQKLKEEVAAGKNPKEAMRDLFEKQIMDKPEQLVYFKTYMEFFKLDELLKKSNELIPAQESKDLFDVTTRKRR